MPWLSLFIAQTSDVPEPVSMWWVPELLLTILWIFVVAAVLGAVRRFWEHQRRG
jgi:hypothetical protein